MGEEGKKRVLVVEDDPSWRCIYAHVFKRVNAEVVSASNVEEARGVLEKGCFTHVVCDGFEGEWEKLVPKAKGVGAVLRVVSGQNIGDEVRAVGADFVDKSDISRGKIRIETLINR